MKYKINEYLLNSAFFITCDLRLRSEGDNNLINENVFDFP